MKYSWMNGIVALGIVATPMISKADEARFWNDIALKVISTSSTAPPIATRNLAMASIAQVDAVNAISGFTKGYSYQGVSAMSNASKEAAVAAAAYSTLKSLFPTQQAMIDQAYSERRAAFGDSAQVVEGLRLGMESAQSILAKRANDGSANAGGTFIGSNEVGAWRPTGPANAPGLLPGWGKVESFTGFNPNQFGVPTPPALSSSQYATAYNEVKLLGAANSTIRTAEQTQIAKIWAAGAGTVTPPGMWNQIASSVAQQRGLSLEENLRMYGQLNMALADAAICCWDTKYQNNFWRPVTAIQNGDLDGNSLTEKDSNWTSLLTTPNHPSFTSGHSTFSATGAAVLAGMFGDHQSFTVSASDLPGVTRSFNSFSAAAAEAGQSRIYGGIHYQFDNQIGLEMGNQVGSFVSKNAYQPVPEPATIATIGIGAAGLLRRRKRKAC
jgi:hypothetical protein